MSDREVINNCEALFTVMIDKEEQVRIGIDPTDIRETDTKVLRLCSAYNDLVAERDEYHNQYHHCEAKLLSHKSIIKQMQAENEKLKTIIQSALWKLPEKPNSAKMKLLEAQNGI